MVRCSYCKKSSCGERTNHSFPLNNPALLEKWLENIEGVDGWVPTVHSRLCSDHFLDDCYTTNAGSSRKILKKGSVPTVFANGPKKCAYCKIPKSRGPVKRSFHKFPFSSVKTLEKWLCNMALKDWYPTKDSLLCSDHFEPSCFYLVRGYLTLRDGSIPSIFSTGSKIGQFDSVSETSLKASPVTDAIESPKSLQPLNIDPRNLSTNPVSDGKNKDTENEIDSSESSITCPRCNLTFEPGVLSQKLKQKSPFNEYSSKRPCIEQPMDQTRISEATVEIGLSTPRKEAGNGIIILLPEPVVASSSTSQQQTEFESPDVNEMKKLARHDHHYETSPLTDRRKLQFVSESNKKLRRDLKMERQRCNRLTKKITSLQKVVGELKCTRYLT